MEDNRKAESPIARLRRRLNLTQEEFAHAIGVTVSTVNRWENGHIEPSRLARKAIHELESKPIVVGGGQSFPVEGVTVQVDPE
jgi:DNA-binding transcriptional regulator YiaG